MTNQDKLNTEARITIELAFEDNRTAESVCRATAPENQETPRGVIAESSTRDNKVICKILSECNLWDLLTTVEDFFEKVDLSLKTIKEIKKNETESLA